MPAKSDAGPRSRSRRLAVPKKRNERGQFEFNCGFALGKARGQKFRVNTSDEREYRRRRNRIAELWDRVVEDGQRHWPAVALEIAKAIARGEERYVLDARSLHHEFVWRPDLDDPDFDPADLAAAENDPLNYVSALHRVQATYGFPIEPHDRERYARGVAQAREEARGVIQQARAEVAELGFVAPGVEPDDVLGPSLHDALRAYITIIANNPKAGDGWKAAETNQVERLLAHHADEPLKRLDRNGVQRLLDYWRGRPPNLKRGGRTKTRTAVNMMKTLLNALESASYSQGFGWSMPAPARDFARTVRDTHAERREKLSRPAKQVFGVEQLATLNRWATPFDRLLLLLGLNCGFGAAEAGRLESADVVLNQSHPFASHIAYRFRSGQAFIRTVRPKSGVLGEWLLWDQTAKVVTWGMERSEQLRCERRFLVTRDTGRPLYDEQLRNAQAGFANVWSRLLARVRRMEDPHFPMLPYGTLRDTIADTVRQHYSDDLASMVISHGSPLSADKLLDSYTNRPFGRLFEALENLEAHFSSVFAAAPDDVTATPPRAYAPRVAGESP